MVNVSPLNGVISLFSPADATVDRRAGGIEWRPGDRAGQRTADRGLGLRHSRLRDHPAQAGIRANLQRPTAGHPGLARRTAGVAGIRSSEAVPPPPLVATLRGRGADLTPGQVMLEPDVEHDGQGAGESLRAVRRLSDRRLRPTISPGAESVKKGRILLAVARCIGNLWGAEPEVCRHRSNRGADHVVLDERVLGGCTSRTSHPVPAISSSAYSGRTSRSRAADRKPRRESASRPARRAAPWRVPGSPPSA